MKWEYHVVHLNFAENSDSDLSIRNPEAASEKMKGSLSPEFIKKEFPDQYKAKEDSPHPAVQLSKYLNEKGKDGWELFESMKLGSYLFLVMKRELI